MFIVEDPINPDRLLESVQDASAGAVVLFLGTVRDHNDKAEVFGIYYEAYNLMAEAAISKIEADARKKWTLTRFAAVHRIGNLKIGEVSVAVAVSAEHRDAAIEAARYAIDRIKTEVPIWKKENMSADQDDSAWAEGVPLSFGGG